MSIQSTKCPSVTRLADYARQERLFTDSEVLDRHFEECRACLDRYVELGRRSLLPDVPDCHIVREIGRGRFGVVYKAWEFKGEPRVVALKVLSCPGEMERERFDREVAALKKLDSPGIVKCHEAGTTGEAMYYTMDLVDGVHLNDYFAHSTTTLNEKLAVFQRVCRAVADAHAEGVVHRDLKPSNILIDADGNPHILDFGICSVDPEDDSSWTQCPITHPGDVIGTLRYMSPEQAWGGVAGAVDDRTDVWALGVMLYELITGGYPYSLEPTPDKGVHEALLERIRKELPNLPRLDGVPRGRDLEVLLARCLAWEPDRRLDSAAVLASDLSRYLSGKRIQTRPPSLAYRLRRLVVGAVARARWTAAAACIATIGVVLWSTTFLFHVGWHVDSSDFAATTRLAPVPADVRDAVVVVGVFDDTGEAVARYAKENGFAGVTSSVTSWRAIHGALMERLADVHPAAVAWDYYFRAPKPGDAALIAGIQRLEASGTPVIVAANDYRDDGSPNLSGELRRAFGRRLRHGAILARDMVERPGEFVLAIGRPGYQPIPGLALTTFASLLHPECRLDLDWSGRNTSIKLLHKVGPGAYLRERGHVELTNVFKTARSHDAARPGDLLACATFDLDSREAWERRTVAYEGLLFSSHDELKALVSGKVVVVGDCRTSRLGFRGDRHNVKYASGVEFEVPGAYLLADAIAGLMDGRYVKAAFPLSPGAFLLLLSFAAVGWLLPIPLAVARVLEPAHHRTMLWLAMFTATASCMLVLTLASGFAAVHIGMAGFSLLSAMTASFWVEFARNRHRQADRKRRAIESFGLAVDATLTLPQKRRRLLQGAG